MEIPFQREGLKLPVIGISDGAVAGKGKVTAVHGNSQPAVSEAIPAEVGSQRFLTAGVVQLAEHIARRLCSRAAEAV